MRREAGGDKGGPATTTNAANKGSSYYEIDDVTTKITIKVAARIRQ